MSLHVCEVRRVPASVCGRRNATLPILRTSRLLSGSGPRASISPKLTSAPLTLTSQSNRSALNRNRHLAPPQRKQGWAWGARRNSIITYSYLPSQRTEGHSQTDGRRAAVFSSPIGGRSKVIASCFILPRGNLPRKLSFSLPLRLEFFRWLVGENCVRQAGPYLNMVPASLASLIFIFLWFLGPTQRPPFEYPATLHLSGKCTQQVAVLWYLRCTDTWTAQSVTITSHGINYL